jgi:hypothetical protein
VCMCVELVVAVAGLAVQVLPLSGPAYSCWEWQGGGQAGPHKVNKYLAQFMAFEYEGEGDKRGGGALPQR